VEISWRRKDFEMEVSGFLRVMAGWTGLAQLRNRRSLLRVELEPGQPAKTERSEGLAGWTGLETKSPRPDKS